MKIGAMARFNRSELTRPQIVALEEDLVLKQRSGEKFGFGAGENIVLYREVADSIDIPRQYAVRQRLGSNVVDETVEGAPVAINFKGELRPSQIPLVEHFMTKIGIGEAKYGGIFSAPCGTGKTVMTMKFLSHIGRPALVLVHTGALVKQWRESITKFTDVRPWEVGHIQQKTCEWRDKKIVVAMVESVIRREYEPEMYRHFGVVVLDEIHRHGAIEWHRAILQFPARLRIGLSATPRRWDGLWDVVRHHVGEVLTKAEGHEVKPKVYCLTTGVAVPSDFFSMRGGRINLALLINLLVGIEGRNCLIVGEAVKALKVGRRVLILSDRLQHLADLKKMFEEAWKADPDVKPALAIGHYVGGMTHDQIDYAKTCNLLLGTMQYAKEGLDDPGMDTLFLTVPKGDVEQPVGRILRSCEGKKEPLVIDLVDDQTGPCVGFARARRNQYARLGFDVFDVNCSIVPQSP